MDFRALADAYSLASAEQERRHAAYSEAREAVAPHLHAQAVAEIERARWLKARRGVPSDVLYHAETGEPRDPELIARTAAVRQAEADVAWCQAVEVACFEQVKGRPLTDVLASNEANRARIEALRSGSALVEVSA